MQGHSFAQVWNQGDPVARITVLILLGMSIFSWTIIFIKSWNYFQTNTIARKVEHALCHSYDFDQFVNSLDTLKACHFRALTHAAQEAFHRHQNQQYWYAQIDAGDWITCSIKSAMDTIARQLQAGLGILASIGSTAPFIGLFGTVWGIYGALLSISQTGLTSIEHVAGPIGESLIMTALGLAVAIPAVLGYNAFTRSNKSYTATINRFAHTLHAYFMARTPSSTLQQDALRHDE